MLHIGKKVTRPDMNDALREWLDRKFGVEHVLSREDTEEQCEYTLSMLASTQEWGRAFRRNVPSQLEDCFLYVVENFAGYRCVNLRSRTLYYYVLPTFFERFPLGQVWFLEVDETWDDLDFCASSRIAAENGMDVLNGELPHEATGLQAGNLVYMALDVLTYGVYPLIVCEFIILNCNLVAMVIPDRAFKYCQMKRGGDLHEHLLRKLCHVFDDQWTHDSSRGFKSASDATLFNPLYLLEYFEWYIGTLNSRLEELAGVTEEHTRQQRAMTLNSILADSFIATTFDLPYLCKTTLFTMLDKVSNFLMCYSKDKKEVDCWKRLLTREFIEKELNTALKIVPKPVGNDVKQSIDYLLNQFEREGVDSDLLRDLRNCQHGYLFNKCRWQKLCKHTGEVNNDISLLALPFWLYLLSKPWSYGT